jgi:TrmH family RNA methyltransferase
MDNPRIRYLKHLAKRRFRETEGKFIIEGVRFVEEALASAMSVEAVIYSAKLFQNNRGKELLECIYKSNVPFWEVTEPILESLSDTATPQGVVAVITSVPTGLQEILTRVKKQLLVLVDGIQDPGNLGTIIRTSDAAGVDAVILSRGTVDLYNPKTLRATMGSLFHLPVIMAGEPVQAAELLLQAGIRLVVGMPQDCQPVYSVDLTGPVALVVGSEANGVSEGLKRLPAIPVNIPMPGHAESLNAAIAAAIMLYEAVRQRSV